MTAIPIDELPDEHDLMLEVARLFGVVGGSARAPAVGSAAWWDAPDDAKLGGLLMLAVAHLIADPETQVRERLKQAAVDVHGGDDWTAVSRRPTQIELERRRSKPGPVAGTAHPDAVARWVETARSGVTAA